MTGSVVPALAASSAAFLASCLRRLAAAALIFVGRFFSFRSFFSFRVLLSCAAPLSSAGIDQDGSC
eukprot:2225542-Ditylum_brightwellii.AAC.1